MKSPLPLATLLITLFFSTNILAQETWGWRVTMEGSDNICYTEDLRPENSLRHASKSLLDEYKSSPLDFSMHWRTRTSLFTSDVIPFQDITLLQLKDINSRAIRQFEATTSNGSVFDGDDNFGYLYSCRQGDETYFKRCIPVYYISVDCLDLNEGVKITKHLKFDHNKNGKLPASKSYQFKSIQKVSLTEAASFLDKYNKSIAARPALMEQRNAEAQARAAQQDKEARAIAALREANQKRLKAEDDLVLKESPVRTSMFCESGEFLLTAGESITKLDYKCDLLANSMKLRELLNFGWEIARETRTPAPAFFGGTGYVISLELKKFK